MNQVNEYMQWMRDNVKAFNYDPMTSKGYDPMTNKNFLPAQGSNWGQFDIQFVNSDPALSHIAEIFSPVVSAAEVQSSEINEAYTAAFQFSTGNLIYTFGAQTVTVSCDQVPYRSLMNSMLTNKYRIEAIKVDVTTTAQINNKLQPFWKSWLGGKMFNSLSIKSQKSADQYQNLIVDMNTPLDMDQERGIMWSIKPSETCTLSFYVSRFDKVTAQ